MTRIRPKDRGTNTLDRVRGMRRLAVRINSEFHIICTQSHIQRWQLWDPPFPSYRENGTWDMGEIRDWVTNVYIPRQGLDNKDLFARTADAKAERSIIAKEREAYEFDVLKGEYIKRTEAEAAVIGCMRQYHSFVRLQIEKSDTDARREKLQTLGVTPEQLAAFHEFDLALARAAIDRVEAKCAELGKDTTT